MILREQRWQDMPPVINTDTGNAIGFTVQGVKDSLKRKSDEQRKAYAGLRDLLEHSRFVDFEPVREGKTNEGHLQGYEVYYGALEIDGERFGVRLKVELPKTETNRDRAYKDHKIVDVEVLSPATSLGSDASAPGVGDPDSGPTQAGGGTISLGQLVGKNKPQASLVVDPETGEPRVLYHGTRADITEFKPGQESDFDFGDSNPVGHFFTPDPEMADYHAERESGANVLPVFLSLKNPKTLQAGRSLERQAKALAHARAEGHDGAIIGGDEFVVFDSTQVKSAIGNTGEFSLAHPDIRYSPQRLSEEFAAKLKEHFNRKQRGPVRLADNTPAALQMFGWNDLPVVVDPNVIDKMHFDHGMTIPQMARLPFLLKRPLMVFADNPNKSLIFVGEHLAPGKIALVAIKPEKQTMIGTDKVLSHMVVTGYSPQNGWVEVVKRVSRGELVYRDTAQDSPGIVKSAFIAAQKKYAQFGRGLPRELLQGSAPRAYGDSPEKTQSGTRSPTVSAARSVLERAYIVLGQSDLVKHETAIWPDGAKFSPARATLGDLTPAQEAAAIHVLGAPKTFMQRLAEFKKDWAKNLKQGIFDQFAPIAELDQNAYIQARLSKGGESSLEALLLYGKLFVGADGATDVRYTKAGKPQGFASKMAELKGEHDRFFLWVAAQRADRLKAIGLENLFSDTDIDELNTLDQGDMKDGTGRPMVYAKALQDLNDFNDNVLEVAVASGLIVRPGTLEFGMSPTGQGA